ncbi:GNAT family N-acetyltransferase [Gimesia fumaroli]|uniref:Putative N-acetyltransferase YjaB n=1 Tax=Gimesia fumaroli TaxID=2527976 RepID=A0A518IG98_9PLAN|nr:GNAT family N-acetyltransferase [Gimesia fumaroli]QDV52113.1 putative N-acetyltransferase YjaB [Gimesia fumaroli]
MTSQHQITAVTPADYPRALEVWESSVRATHDFLTEADIHLLKPLVYDQCLIKMPLVCIRDETDSVIGFLGVDAPKIEALFIEPDWRGKGLGRQLVDYAIKNLEAELVDVNEQNVKALGFYLHLGFEVVHRSERDGFGKPFPLLHLKLPG